MNSEHFDLNARRALVYGADLPAGRAIADIYEEAGAKVVRLSQMPAAEVKAAVAEAAAALGAVDILAAAPDFFLARPVLDVTVDDLAEVMMANFAAQYFAIQGVLPVMRKAQAGHIVLVTSVLGERGLPNTSAYSAAHGAVFNLIRALSQELAPEHISINGIELGWMDWMSDRIDPGDEEAARAVRFAMLKRPGRAEDVGPLALWLSGSGAGFVTGQVFPLDGGLTQHL
ncbi:MAG: SDR family NAD(P)-dependent oxidoreductase [Pseudomonadota bacterium]